MNVSYVGPCFDYSGYGEANRHFIAALDAAGVNVEVFPLSYVMETADFGRLGQLCRKLSEQKLDYKIRILHITPDQYPIYAEAGKYNIGHLFWETSKLPDEFVRAANEMNEIWTGSPTNAEAIRSSGVKVPVFVAPQPIEIDRPKAEPYKIPGLRPETFIFYSIFEWTERKNPRALIRAFMEEFEADEDVVLLVKSYVNNFTQENTRFIQNQIKAIRSQYGHDRGRILLYKYLMDRDQIERFHATGHCYVSAHRGEGWGIPIVEAMLHGHPVISTGYNGVHDYLDESNAILLPYTLVGVQNNRNSTWYSSNQKWANVDNTALKAAMRKVYNDKKSAYELGLRAQSFVINKFNFKAVGQLMADRLRIIERDFV